GVFGNTNDDLLTDSTGPIIQCPNQAPTRATQALQQGLAASGPGLATGTGAASNGFDPDRTLLHAQHPSLLFNHGCAPVTAWLRDSAIRSAVIGGISPTTVARYRSSAATRRRLTATVGPSCARRSSARLSLPKGSMNRVKRARPSE